MAKEEKKSRIVDMTQGSPGRLILGFALPLMLGNVFQQLYTFVDTLVVGQALGVNALAALGASEWLTFLMFGSVQGLAQGFSVIISQKFGAGQDGELRRAVFQAALLSVAVAVLLTALGQAALPAVLTWMGTPEEIRGLALLYLRFIYAGIPAAILYNTAAAVLRAVGDSRTPLRAMTASSVCNIVLDLLFVLVLDMGIPGAAVSTVLAQLLSGICCLIGIRFLCVLAAFFPLLYILYITRACVQGMGDGVFPMLSSAAQLVMRVGCALFLIRLIGESGVFFGEVMAWAGADLLLAGRYFYLERKIAGRKIEK